MPPTTNQYLPKVLIPVFIILFFFLSLFAYTKLAGPIPFNVSSVVTTKTDTFTVTGEGKANIKPDSATVRVGVQANGPTAKTAQDQLNLAINKVTDAIKAMGIDSSDIKTDNYNVYPLEEVQPLAKTAGDRGYSANTNITIKVKEPENANKVVDAATSNGANLVGGVSFDATDKTAAENEARQMAVKSAKEKAEQTAKIAGFKLGRLINYSEGFNGRVYPLAMDEKAAQGGSETNLEPGSQDVVINVNLSYEIN